MGAPETLDMETAINDLVRSGYGDQTFALDSETGEPVIRTVPTDTTLPPEYTRLGKVDD